MRKKYTIVVLLTVIFGILSFMLIGGGEDKFYYAFYEKIPLVPVEGKFVIRYHQKVEEELAKDQLKTIFQDISVSWIDEKTAVISMVKKSALEELRNGVLQSENVSSIQPMYKVDKGAEMLVVDELVISAPDQNKKKIEMLHKEHRLTVIETNRIYQRLKVPKGGDALEIANRYQESGLVKFSHPNFLALIKFNQAVPNDPYFINQFYLRNTGQVFNPAENHSGTPGADISILGAWDVTLGNNNVVVAVIDQGVTSNHPDLPNTRQIRLNGSNFSGGNANDPSPTGDSYHGNACAGIIAATRNNGDGIAGIAPNVNIMPIRVVAPTLATVLANAILFAADNGADVISNSWTLGNTSNPNQYPVVVNAIQYAVTNGRGGLGSVMVFGAGNGARHDQNDPGFVEFPSNVNISGVFTVGASDRDDLQANYSPTSNPGSPNNQIIDIVAPSNRANPPAFGNAEHSEVWTIDIPGTSGRNPSKIQIGNIPIGEVLPNTGSNFLAYTGRFGGTSAATAQIAGIAALILSVNPNLAQWQVFNIITGTADQVGGYNYINGRSNELGNGRANACKAVYAAIASVVGPDYLCSTNTFTLQNAPAGSTVTWSVSPTHLFSANTSGSSSSATLSSSGFSASGQATITFEIETDCGEVEIQRSFWVGRAVSSIEGPYEMAVNTVENYFATGNPYMGITDYQWSVFPSGYHWIGNQGTNGITLSFSATGLYSLEMDVVNPCGARGSEIGIYVYNPWEHFTLYPNPTSDILHIRMDLETRGRDVDQDFEVSLYDGQGRELIPAKQAHQEASLDLSRIPKGFYYVHIRYRDALLRRQIRVER